MVPWREVSDNQLPPEKIEYRYVNILPDEQMVNRYTNIDHTTEDTLKNRFAVLTANINKLKTASKPPKKNKRTLEHQQQSRRKKGDGQLQFIENIGSTKK